MKRLTMGILTITSLSIISITGMLYYKNANSKNLENTASNFQQITKKQYTSKKQEEPGAKIARLREATLAGNKAKLSPYFDWVTRMNVEGEIDWEDLYQGIKTIHDQKNSTATWHLYELMMMKGNEEHSFNPYYNHNNAYKYLVESAKQGEHIAQITLKNFYQYGDAKFNIEPDLIMAAVWRSIISRGEFDALMSDSTNAHTKNIRKQIIKDGYQPDPLDTLKRYITEPTDDELERFNQLYTEYQQLYPTRLK